MRGRSVGMAGVGGAGGEGGGGREGRAGRDGREEPGIGRDEPRSPGWLRDDRDGSGMTGTATSRLVSRLYVEAARGGMPVSRLYAPRGFSLILYIK